MRYLDNAQMTVSGTPGTGTITLGSANPPHLVFSASGAQDGDAVVYYVVDGTASEVGWGVIGGGVTTITRNLIKSSTGSLLSLTSAAVISIVDNSFSNPDPFFHAFLGGL